MSREELIGGHIKFHSRSLILEAILTDLIAELRIMAGTGYDPWPDPQGDARLMADLAEAQLRRAKRLKEVTDE